MECRRQRKPGRRHVRESVLDERILGSVLDDAELDAIEARCQAASPGPWKSFVEGRDHWSGDDFIRVGDDDDEPDMYVSRATAEGLRPASVRDLDFIAGARQDIPRLLAEIHWLRSQTLLVWRSVCGMSHERRLILHDRSHGSIVANRAPRHVES